MKPVQITGAWRSGRGPRTCVTHFFFLSRHYHYLSLVPINLIRPSARHSAMTVRCSVNIFSRSALAGGPFFFLPGPGPELGGPAYGKKYVAGISKYHRFFQLFRSCLRNYHVRSTSLCNNFPNSGMHIFSENLGATSKV